MQQFPVMNLPQLSRGGDSSRKHKGEPILKCRRCAKEEEERQKRENGMGCGYEPPEGDQEVPDETSEATLDLGCDKCQGRRRKKKRAMDTSTMPIGVLRLQGQEVLGQVPLASTPVMPRPTAPRATMAGSCPGHTRLGQTCPAGSVPLDPTLNCQHDARGNAVCSNGLHFPPGCPKTPPEEYFSPGIAPDEVHGGILEAKIPPARGTPGAPPLVGSDSGGAGGAAAPSGGTNILPYAAGGIAVIGLLYALLR
jgi:hypothetical protein